MRTPALAFCACALGTALAACDSSDPAPCFITTADSRVFAVVRAPGLRDTVRVGQPFLFRADYVGEGDIPEVGARLTWSPPGADPAIQDSVLFEIALRSGPGLYTIERELTVPALPGGASVSDFPTGGQFYVGAYGQARFSECGGTGGSVAGMDVPVTVLD